MRTGVSIAVLSTQQGVFTVGPFPNGWLIDGVSFSIGSASNAALWSLGLSPNRPRVFADFASLSEVIFDNVIFAATPLPYLWVPVNLLVTPDRSNVVIACDNTSGLMTTATVAFVGARAQ